MNNQLITEDDRIQEFTNLWEKMGCVDDKLVIHNEALMTYLNEGGFFTAPASSKYHGVYEGGLYDHSKTVAARLHWLTQNNKLKWKRPESPFIVGMFHDLCKCDQYIIVSDSEPSIKDSVAVWGSHYEYNPDTILKGHGSKSIMILSQFMTLTEEEMLCIRYHMGPYEKDEWGEFDRAIKKYQNVYWTHAADMLASKVDGV